MILNRLRLPTVSKLSQLAFARNYSRKDFAFVFDIDGVLIRGKDPIAAATPALELLNEHRVPYILMTNGGGVSEKAKADHIAKIVGVPISPWQIVQSHTPLRTLANDRKHNRVLCIGGVGDAVRHVAKSYGFEDVVLPIDIVKAIPSISPHHMFKQDDFDKYAIDIDVNVPFRAILVFNDPRDMSTDVQIVQDLLNSQDGVLGTKRKRRRLEDPAIPIVFSNSDVYYSNEYSLPRFGQGAFRIITEELYSHINQLRPHEAMSSLLCGKPFKLQYDFAHHVLIDWREMLITNKFEQPKYPLLGTAPTASPFKNIYMVGDNPASDIQGANDHGWESVLLRTGVYADEDLSSLEAQPTAGVFNDVYDAVLEILRVNKVKI
ncbi:uncharacterized protein SPAPADRAFT_58223 [Spathaspora passalidarum NRRL Y-27907]|uniref:HAD-superfamily hydrolase n=1 Tax=Spathaspora passalidarum (strain NRRL Y-27907 / 11-Y1) TaxID=619300 RepID=G3AFU4_SPAPN|nr:uncharacterized protein SPAPADRAFT_58223 [Spathaspora passalidarum NRRL Y-27907]EGW35083.1 hypothetical protein SPAPADRAFT_58223 [Spathaspora passalidarum NRRL Y-27907]